MRQKRRKEKGGFSKTEYISVGMYTGVYMYGRSRSERWRPQSTLKPRRAHLHSWMSHTYMPMQVRCVRTCDSGSKDISEIKSKSSTQKVMQLVRVVVWVRACVSAVCSTDSNASAKPFPLPPSPSPSFSRINCTCGYRIFTLSYPSSQMLPFGHA